MHIYGIDSRIARTTTGEPIYGRVEYVFELGSEKDAEYCVASLTMGVKSACPASELYDRGKYLVLGVTEKDAHSGIVEQVTNTIRQITP